MTKNKNKKQQQNPFRRVFILTENFPVIVRNELLNTFLMK